ncbi:7834_t:CDS:2, partial [Ambispora gerdemannii]
MNFEFSAPNLHELEQLVTTLVSAKTKKDGTVVYHLRIGIQKFISQEQLDRNGETYWRMYSAETQLLSLTNTKKKPMPNNPILSQQLTPQLVNTVQQLSTSLKAIQPISLDYLPNFQAALTGFYEENVKATVETKAQEFKDLLQSNITHGQKTQQAL